ncbi:hypothetical protein [Gracilimonas mengyeensis]|uniref:DUF3037 domain-containing protein n=1 Tax=Gracilimonas mengyeensis TaxID=1302730 RepID=A0A521BPA3_9BACT|nr:hypothetical protein [Gracilimonas mengyeensis]SMO48390.1 hypothetical protein SAMN06265219_102405 [Gracilimonas mengyeensis]
MDSIIIQYRIFYWVPNTLSGERIAIGLCLYDKETMRLDTHWISQKELTRLQKIYSQTNREDAKDMLNLLDATDGNWKSKAYDSSFWNYIERYWNGILQISESRKLYYEGTAADFTRKSAMLKNQFLPLSKPVSKRAYKRAKTIIKNFEKWVKAKELQERVSLGVEIPEHGKYHLLKSIYLDLGAYNETMTGSAGIDFSLKEATLIDKLHGYFQAFQSIKRIDKGGDLSLVIHKQGAPYQAGENRKTKLYDDFRYRCEELSIGVLQLDELEEYIEGLSEKTDLRPLEPMVAE